MPSGSDQISPSRPSVKPHPLTRHPEIHLFFLGLSPAVIRQWMTIPRQANARVKLIKSHPATPSRQTSSTVVPATALMNPRRRVNRWPYLGEHMPSGSDQISPSKALRQTPSIDTTSRDPSLSSPVSLLR